MGKKRRRSWGCAIFLVALYIMVLNGLAFGQVTTGTVFSKTEDGVGNKITSTVVGPARGLDVNVIATTGGSTYLDADGIANQTASAVHGQTYMYNGATWDRVRGDTTNGVWVNCKLGCGAGGSTTITGLITVADAGNSTLVTLGIGGNFTGAAFDLTNYASWSVSVFANVGSAANGFTIEWSEDNVNWGAADVTTYVSAQTDMASFGHKARYVRINYTNSGVAQVTFRVYAWAHPFVRQTRKFVGNALEDTDTAQIVISSLQGHTTAGGGAWVPVKVNPSGALTADVTQATSPWVVSGTVGVSNAFLLDATFTGRWTAASLDADAIANETTTSVHGKCYLYNGATWDRCRGSVANGLTVSVSNATLAVTQSGTWNIGTVTTVTTVAAVTSITNTVTVAGNKTNNNAAPGATNVGTLPCVATAVAPTQTEGNQVGCSVNLSGAQRVIEQNAIATANLDGSCPSGAASFTVAASNASRTWLSMWASPANTDDVYIKLGATATNADGRFAPGQPLNFTSGRIYTGVVDAFPASGTQAVCVLELN